MDDVVCSGFGPRRVRGTVVVVGCAGCRAMGRGRCSCGRLGQVAGVARPGGAEGCRPNSLPRRRPLPRRLPLAAHLGPGHPDDGGRALAPWFSRAWDRRSNLHRDWHGPLPLLTHYLARVARIAPRSLRPTLSRNRRGELLAFIFLDTSSVIVDAPVFQFLRRRTGETKRGRRYEEQEGSCSYQP